MTPEALIDAVVRQYLTSGDFNGLPAYALVAEGSVTADSLRAALLPLVNSGELSVNFGDRHPNPHIRAFEDPPAADQASKLEADTEARYVIYPSARTLAARVNPLDFAGRPFSLMLALGAGQLEDRAFDLAVLDHYRRDPRYRLSTNDIHATLSVRDEAYESSSFLDKHKVLIQHFGYCYTDTRRRAVTVFLTDLDGLTPEHQQLWATHAVEGQFHLHPDYYDSAIRGDWGQGTSLRDALAEELRIINAMCVAIGWPPLFRKADRDLPHEVAFLLRPTAGALNEFVLALDNLLSDNINASFFPSSIPRKSERDLGDGKVEVQQRGTLALLEEWLKTHFHTPDPKPLEEAIAVLRRVRKLRQTPAHALDDDRYDEALFEEQRALFVDAYSAVRTLRLMLQNHPKARPVLAEIDERVVKGQIWPW